MRKESWFQRFCCCFCKRDPLNERLTKDDIVDRSDGMRDFFENWLQYDVKSDDDTVSDESLESQFVGSDARTTITTRDSCRTTLDNSVTS
jgi:hypothetical protein